MLELHFYIHEHVDGNLEIGTKHIHYMYRDDLNFDNFKPERLNEIKKAIAETCKKEGITAWFETYRSDDGGLSEHKGLRNEADMFCDVNRRAREPR